MLQVLEASPTLRCLASSPLSSATAAAAACCLSTRLKHTASRWSRARTSLSVMSSSPRTSVNFLWPHALAACSVKYTTHVMLIASLHLISRSKCGYDDSCRLPCEQKSNTTAHRLPPAAFFQKHPASGHCLFVITFAGTSSAATSPCSPTQPTQTMSSLTARRTTPLTARNTLACFQWI